MVCAVNCRSINQPPGNREVFICDVHGFAKFIGIEKGGDCVDADDNPLLKSLCLQKVLFFGPESAAGPRFPPTCLWHRNVKDAAFCR